MTHFPRLLRGTSVRGHRTPVALPARGSRPLGRGRPTRAAAVLAAVLVLASGAIVATSPSGRALESVTSTGVGDFETTGLTPQGWSVSAPSPNRGVVSTSRAISGARSLLAEDTSTTAAVVVARRITVTAGQAYHAQGYAYTTRGVQSLTLTFFDASGARVGATTSPTTGAVMVWSRIEARATAPAGATTATLQVSSSNAALSNVWWDALDVISPTTPNGGFESEATSTSPAPGWSLSASGGASVGVTTAAARLGRRALQITDATATGSATAVSSLTPAFPNVVHEVRAWVRPASGTFTMTARWYDASRKLIVIKSVPVTKPANTWSLVVSRFQAPANARWAAVQFSTSVAGSASGAWDVVSVVPAAGAPTRSYVSTTTDEPLDAFSNSNTSAALTVDGRAKLATVVSGYPSEFQMVDLETGTLDTRLPVDGMDVGWAVAVGRDGNVYLGGTGGHLWRYGTGSRSLTDLGAATSRSTTIWDLQTGPDGRIWGASYPASELWAYDPGTGEITSLGSVSAAHDYARSVAVDSDYAYVGVGSVDPTIVRVSLSDPTQKTEVPLPTTVTSGNISQLDPLGRFLLVRTASGATRTGKSYTSERRLYDTRTGSWDVPANMTAQSPSGVDSAGRFYYLSYKQLWAVDSATGEKSSVAPTAMVAGRERQVLRASIDGVDGEWLLAYDPYGFVRAIELSSFTERTFRVAFQPTKMRIKALDQGPDGSIYAGGFGGSSLAVVHPDSGQRQQYPASPGASNVIGEVEGTTAHGSYQYIGTYTDGKIFRYDTTQPWVDGSNPRLLTTLGSSYRQDRPLAWATSGARTFFGTIPKYGVLGGALGIIDSDTSAPVVVPGIVTNQSVVSLAASGSVVFGGTSRWGGLGATPTQKSAAVFAYDAATRRKLWESTPIPGVEAYGAVAMGPGGTVWAAAGPLLVELDPRTGALLRKVMIYPAPATTGAVFRNADLVYLDGVFYLAAMDRIYVVDPVTLRVTAAVPSGVSTPRLAVGSDRIYFASGTLLRSVNR